MAFATVSDLEARWRPLSDSEKEKAGVLLEDASAYLSALICVCPMDSEQEPILRKVTCSMVQRSMSADMDAFGLSSMSMTAGSYSQSMSYANPSGDFYLTGFEKKLLAKWWCGDQVIGTIRPKVWCLHD